MDKIVIDQEKYCYSLEEMKLDRKAELDEELNREEYTQYRGLIGKVSWLDTHTRVTRPDLSFDTGDVLKIKKTVRKAKSKGSAVKF